MVQMTDGTPYS